MKEFKSDKEETIEEFMQEQFSMSKMEGVKGIVAGLLMEDGKIDLVVTGMNWKQVLWVASQIVNFASETDH